ncbi:hypothetical protein EG328_009196 [Venturia inaequalis]|uniref:Transmembrane protein n=1 Tax=Venturia inaequalis TaxID=5025 RepID=A0A8H3YQS0_VENIN|nr:hypothetical protein EG328_009196 [Venturia inaequalis]
MPSTDRDRQRVKNKRVEDEASHIATKRGERIVIPLWVPLATVPLFSLAVVATAKFLYLESKKKAKLAEAAARKVKEEARAAKEAREAQRRGWEELEEWSSSDSDSGSDGEGDEYTEGSSTGSGSGSETTSDSGR